MSNLREIQVLLPKAIYRTPTFKVGEKGLERVGNTDIFFVKGLINKPDAITQQGVTTEGLLSVIKAYLEENNVDQFKNEFTTGMIAKVDEIFAMIDKRNADRVARQVQNTDKA